MKILNKMRIVFMRGCALTALVTLVMYLIVFAATDMTYLELSQFLLIFAFGIIISLSQEFYRLRTFHIFFRILFQYASLLISFMLLFVATGKIEASAAKIMIYIILFTAIYSAICGIAFPIMRATGYYKKHLSQQYSDDVSNDKPYQNRYS